MSARYEWTLTERSTQLELNVAIAFTAHPGERAIRSGHPDRWTPGEPASVEFESVLVEGETVAVAWDAACERFEIDERDLSERVLEARDESGFDRDEYEPDYDASTERCGEDAR